jgi:DNA polymerase
MIRTSVNDFASFRSVARNLLAADVHPQEVMWEEIDQQQGLFECTSDSGMVADVKITQPKRVSRQFFELAHDVACHKDIRRWSLLYQLLWRISRKEPRVLEDMADPLVLQLLRMRKQVRFDRHKMTAFVRFRRTTDGSYIAWYEPEHHIGEFALPYFVRRYAEMEWALLMPEVSFYWNKSELLTGAGVASDPFDGEDGIEELWKGYYAAIFNPARVKVKMMKREMPVRYWKTLPETELIPDLLERSQSQVRSMRSRQQHAASVPITESLGDLKHAASWCSACSLCRGATQVVFGEGPSDARLVLVGEQPGDQEDISGVPFVGPAGQVLMHALELTELKREDLYLTNAVKHFKYEQRGKRRLHKRPSGSEINSCKPWLYRELELIQPAVIVCLGQTAAQSVVGRAVSLKESMGRRYAFALSQSIVLVTYHPSAILRSAEFGSSPKIFNSLVTYLRYAKTLLLNPKSDFPGE